MVWLQPKLLEAAWNSQNLEKTEPGLEVHSFHNTASSVFSGKASEKMTAFRLQAELRWVGQWRGALILHLTSWRRSLAPPATSGGVLSLPANFSEPPVPICVVGEARGSTP